MPLASVYQSHAYECCITSAATEAGRKSVHRILFMNRIQKLLGNVIGYFVCIIKICSLGPCDRYTYPVTIFQWSQFRRKALSDKINDASTNKNDHKSQPS